MVIPRAMSQSTRHSKSAVNVLIPELARNRDLVDCDVHLSRTYIDTGRIGPSIGDLRRWGAPLTAGWDRFLWVPLTGQSFLIFRLWRIDRVQDRR